MEKIFLNLKECITSKYARFSGRANRKEYWLFVLGNVIVSIALPLVGFILGMIVCAISTNDAGGIVSVFFAVALVIWSIALIIPSLSVTIRRLHDLDKSGWTIFVYLIPLAGPIILLVWLCTKGTPTENKYGPVTD